MAQDFRRFRGGEVPEPRDLNLAYAALRRLRKLSGAGGVAVDGARGPGPPALSIDRGERIDIQLTGAYSAGYPWAEVLVTPSGSVVATGRTGSAAADPAFERRVGDTSLAAG